MSASVPVEGPSVVTVRPQRIRNENALSLGGGMKEIFFTAIALGAGAIGAYFLVDYLNKKNVFDKLGDLIPGTQLTGTPEQDDTANIAYVQSFDRTTRYGSIGGYSGLSAYRGQKLPGRLPPIEPEEEVEIDDVLGDPGLNQIDTGDRVWEYS